MDNHTYHRIKNDVWGVRVDGKLIGYIGRKIGRTRWSGAEFRCWSYQVKYNNEWMGMYGNRQLARLALMNAVNPSNDSIPSVGQSVSDISFEIVATPV
jgi:hypothetical protein